MQSVVRAMRRSVGVLAFASINTTDVTVNPLVGPTSRLAHADFDHTGKLKGHVRHWTDYRDEYVYQTLRYEAACNGNWLKKAIKRGAVEEIYTRGAQALEAGELGEAQCFFEATFEAGKTDPSVFQAVVGAPASRLNAIRWALAASRFVATWGARDDETQETARKMYATLCFVTGRFAECMATAETMSMRTPGKVLLYTLPMLLRRDSVDDSEWAKYVALGGREDRPWHSDEAINHNLESERILAFGINFARLALDPQPPQKEKFDSRKYMARLVHERPGLLSWKPERKGDPVDTVQRAFVEAFASQREWLEGDPVVTRSKSSHQTMTSYEWGRKGLQLVTRPRGAYDLQTMIQGRIWLECWKRKFCSTDGTQSISDVVGVDTFRTAQRMLSLEMTQEEEDAHFQFKPVEKTATACD